MPTGVPTPNFFWVGAAGGILACAFWPFLMVNMPIIGFMATGLGIVLESVGIYGFYRNYGDGFHVFAAGIGMVGGGLFAAIWLLLYGMGMLYYFFLGFVISIIMLITYGILAGVSFMKARHFTGMADVAMATAIFFFLGGPASVISNVLAAYVFTQAYVPYTYSGYDAPAERAYY